MKDKIAYNAIRLFDKNGYHGTSMRDIGNLAGCKMPTVYYYYKSKEELFDTVVCDAFEEMIIRLQKDIPKDLSLQESCAFRVIQKKNLSQDDKIIYRLAIKTWLGFEGCDFSRQKLLQWEQARYEENYRKYAEIIQSPIWVRFLTRSITNMIERIILLEENPDDDEIKQEISMIFEIAEYHNKD